MAPDKSPDPLAQHGVLQVTTPAERSRAFFILFVSLCCMGAGQTVLFNILPPLSRQLHLSEVETTTVFAVSAAIWVVSATFWGKRSDHWGRKPVLLLGLISFAASFALFASVMLGGLDRWLPAFLVFPLMIVSRSLYGLLGSGASPAAQAYVADRTTPQERMQGMALVGSAFGLGTAVGPAIASVFSPFGLLAPFYFISGLALASAALIWFLLPERTPPKAFAHRTVGQVKWHDPRILPFVIFSIVLSTASTVPVQTMGFFFIDMLHLPAKAQPYYISVGQISSSVAALFAQFVIVRYLTISSRLMTTIGLAAAILCCVVFLFTASFPILVIGLAAQGLGFGMARPGFTTGASLSVSPHEQGAVAGVIGGASAMGFIGGPLIGWMYEQSPYVPYVFGGVLLAGLAIYQWLSPTLRNAGVIPPDLEIVEEDIETPVAKG